MPKTKSLFDNKYSTEVLVTQDLNCAQYITVHCTLHHCTLHTTSLYTAQYITVHCTLHRPCSRHNVVWMPKHWVLNTQTELTAQ